MSEIYDPDNTFHFEKLKLVSPVEIQGGNHFIKYSINMSPLYIQSPKCKVKSGILKAGKKWVCDLMFTIENESLIQWLEELETFSKKYIFENRTKWFETSLEEHDIDNSFTSPLKTYKSGKFYTIRVNIASVFDKPNMKIYDESENILEIDDIKENANIISILEFQGIKCSPKSFQIEIEMKQLLLLNPIDIFEKCILHRTGTKVLENTNRTLESAVTIPKEQDLPHTLDANVSSHDTINVHANSNDIPSSESVINKTKTIVENNSEPGQEPDQEISEVEEIEINLDEISTTTNENSIVLKNRNDVYYEMYREALRKAKLAKDLALSTYLEAKRIKNLYMLDDISDESVDYEYDNMNQMDKSE
jgi:hypothetical protein